MGIAIVSLHHFIGKLLVILTELGKLAANQTFGGENGIFRVGYSLPFSSLADESLTTLGECNNGWSSACAFGVLKHLWLSSLHDSHA